MDQIRQRNNGSDLEIRDGRRLCFYAAIFDHETIVSDFVPGERERRQFREIVRPGAFLESLRGNDEIVANIDHDDTRVFAQKNAGELILTEDKKGLFATAWIPETKLGDGILHDIDRKRITGCSFRSRMIEGGDIWDNDLCQVVKAPLIDVCLTSMPAYADTSVQRMRTDKYKILLRKIRILKLNTK